MKKNNNLIILAIETSCDDTAISVMKISNPKSQTTKFRILSNVVSSQVKIHKKYGGVYPFLAKREHQKNLPLILKKALNKAGNPKINFIAVTVGPGLEPCLWTGINFAKNLAEKLKISIIPVNHIEAHIFANFAGENSTSPFLKKGRGKMQNLFPAVCLVVSGGHTQLILMKDFGKYKILGETRDDAAGECFDKIARILGLDYPGGPAIAAEATKSQITNYKLQIKLPRPMIYQKNYDFSFSGLKTAVLYKIKSEKRGSLRSLPHLTPRLKPRQAKSEKYIQKMCREVQQAIIDVLIHKTIKIAKDFKAKSIILGGGVAANKELRKQFKKRIQKEIPGSKFYIPDFKYCLDNAIMIGITAYFNWLKNKTKIKKEPKAEANLRI
jgi:N6-L-threonylcarbamoyladenine synthase